MPYGEAPDCTRRHVLAGIGLGAAGLLLHAPLAAAAAPWASVGLILSRIRRPTFPKRDFLITDFGAAGDGRVDCTAAIRAAIEACHAAGGGRVLVPAGTFLTGAVRLLGRVDLHLAAGSTLKFRTDPAAYLPVVLTRWEGNDCYNYSPFVYAVGQRNIAITGTGTLDGDASNTHWWPWIGKPEFGWQPGMPRQGGDRARLEQQGEAGVPVAGRVYGAGHYLRPALVEPYGCTDVLIEGIAVRNAPMWSIHPFLCQSVTIRGVRVTSQGPNNDGCDPECCQDVLVEGCTFDTLDDCIAVKSGRGRDGIARGVPSSGIVVRDCRMHRGGGGFAIGSEESGGVNNVFVERLTMDDPRIALGILIKSNSYRGGTVRDIYLRDITMEGCTGTAVMITYNFGIPSTGGPYRPVFDNLSLSNLACERSKLALVVSGYPDDPIRTVRLTDCAFRNVTKPAITRQHVLDLRLTRVTVNGRPV